MTIIYKGDCNMKKLISTFLVLTVFVCILAACATETTYENEQISFVSENEVLELYEMLENNEEIPFTITDTARQMLAEHPEYFKNATVDDVSDIVDYSLEYKHLAKNIDSHGDKIAYVSEASVLSIYETKLDGENYLTEMQVMDYNGNSFYLFALDRYENIFENDILNVHFLPIADTSFENVSGGTTLAIVGASCYMEKVEY